MALALLLVLVDFLIALHSYRAVDFFRRDGNLGINWIFGGLVLLLLENVLQV